MCRPSSSGLAVRSSLQDPDLATTLARFGEEIIKPYANAWAGTYRRCNSAGHRGRLALTSLTFP
jgi:hypothetical protein